MSVRFTCDVDGLAGDNWVDVSERWTRAEFRELMEADAEESLDIFRRKVTACHLPPETGDVVTDPLLVNDKLLEALDLRVVGFLGAVLV